MIKVIKKMMIENKISLFEGMVCEKNIYVYVGVVCECLCVCAHTRATVLSSLGSIEWVLC